DIAGAAHVGRELIDLVETAVHHAIADAEVAQVADHEVVSVGRRELRILEVGAAHEHSLALEAAHEMASDEPTRSTDQCRFHVPHPRFDSARPYHTRSALPRVCLWLRRATKAPRHQGIEAHSSCVLVSWWFTPLLTPLPRVGQRKPFSLRTPGMTNLIELRISEREPFASGREFGSVGAYERLVGRAHF